jgi:hypothetical protein
LAGSVLATSLGTGLSAALASTLVAAIVVFVVILSEPARAFAAAPMTATPTVPPGTDSSWWSQMQEQIQTAEYEISWQDETVLPGLERVWHAPNRSQDLRTYFTDDGIRVVRRTESTPSWELGLALIGYGRGESVSLVGKATLSPLGNRIDYDRTEIVEWYVNDRRGLEQGFTLAVPPEQLAAWGDDGKIVVGGRNLSAAATDEGMKGAAYLALELTGSLSPVVSADGQAIDFAAPGGTRVCHYAQLKVTDASGRELAAWMEGFAEAGVRGIRILFEDEDAAYPVNVDPLLTGPAWTVEGNQDWAHLGNSVSTAGDVNGDRYADVIVGATHFDNGQIDEGRAFVYHGSSSGLSTVPNWTAEGDQDWTYFGTASTAGDVNGDGYADIVIGAPSYDNGQTDEGRVFVYHGSPAGLSTSPDWTAECDRDDANFGRSVSTAGDVNGDGHSDVIVGADAYDGHGRAYVYHGSSRGLNTAPDWITEGGQAGAEFGGSVSTAGDVDGDGHADVIVGAELYDNGETDEGRAYVYHGSATGLSATADWVAEGNQPDAGFGVSVSTAGDVNGDGHSDVIIGARHYSNGETAEGRAFLYHGSETGLDTAPGWFAEGNQAAAWFGHSVSTAGDVNGDGYADVIVGAVLYDNGVGDEGRVFIYRGSDLGLSWTANWTAAGSWAHFGRSVSTAGDVNGDGYSDIIVGEDGYGDVETSEGRAYIYYGSASGPGISAGWTAEGNNDDAYFGYSVSTAGDVNGDGYADIIIGAIGYDNGQTAEGLAFVYLGSVTGPSSSPDWSAESDQAGAWLGWSVSTAGDVNGDGYADVIVGASEYDNGEEGEGRAYVYHGSASGLSATADWTTESDQVGADFGYSVATAGDVNGDGYADIIIGAYLHDNLEVNEGRAYLYYGSSAGLSTNAAWTADGNQSGAWFGHSVSTAGDVNGDGYDDVVVGAYLYDNGETAEGRAYVYHGSAVGLAATADWAAESNLDWAHFGYSVATAGDVNGDGYADVIVGAYSYDNGETVEGKAFVYQGSSAGLNDTADWTAESDEAGAWFGWSVSKAGDINGDGYADVIVGAFHHTNIEEYEGSVSVYHGSSAGLRSVPDWFAEGGQFHAFLGFSVSTAGDVNGDGYADVIVGASGFDNGNTDEGQALLYYGNDGPGLLLRPQQRRADGLAPIAPGGRSREPGSFRLATLGRTPFGRGRVRLESEVKALGQPFDGTGTQQGPWLDTGTAGVALDELVTGLEPGPHHWRLRLRYDPVTLPFLGASRWFTVPWNGWEERDLTVSPFLGGTVWEDRDGDGVMQPDEPRLYGVLVHLLDHAGWVLQTTVTGGDGRYRFDVGSGEALRVQFEAPVGWAFTVPDQGVDDLLDSDADTVSGMTTLIAPPFDSLDEERWSAGLGRVGICRPPDETVYIYNVTLTTDGNDYPVLHFQDPNQRSAVTGYNVYRASDAGLPHAQWPLMADDVIDMDEAEPNKQWVDTSGDVSPSGLWYYQVATYNHDCPEETAEGPW